MASLTYVTGVPGSGKSALRRELRRRGLPAFGTDEDRTAAEDFESAGALPIDSNASVAEVVRRLLDLTNA